MSLLISLIFLFGVVATSRAAEVPASSEAEPLVSLADFDLAADYAGMYFSGDVAGAVARADRIASETDDLAGRGFIYLDQLYMCDSVDDFACVEAALFRLLSTLDEIDGEIREDFRRQARVWSSCSLFH